MPEMELLETYQEVRKDIIIALYNDDLPYEKINDKILLLTGSSYGDTELKLTLNKMIEDKKIAKVGNVYSMISC